MPDLIATLHAQHVAIKRGAAQVSDASDRGDVPEVCDALEALGAVLLAHLAFEDERLYPALTGTDQRKRFEMPAKIARTYARDMKTIGVALRAFFEKYSHGFMLADFRRDWILVSQLLADRIESEETTLYPLYESWVGST